MFSYSILCCVPLFSYNKTLKNRKSSVLTIIGPLNNFLIDSPFVFQVIYEVETNGTFGVQKVSVSFGQTNLTVEPGTSLQQQFIIRFKVRALLSGIVRGRNVRLEIVPPLLSHMLNRIMKAYFSLSVVASALNIPPLTSDGNSTVFFNIFSDSLSGPQQSKTSISNPNWFYKWPFS